MLVNKMINFFKERWLWLLIMLLLAFILFYFIPGQEKYYLEAEQKAIEQRSKLIVFILWGVLALIVLINFLRSSKLSDLPYAIVAIGVILLSMYFALTPFIQSGILLLNKIKTNETVSREFIVEAFNNDKSFILFFDKETKESVDLSPQLIPVDTSRFERLDTITVSFRKGLLGYKYILGPERK